MAMKALRDGAKDGALKYLLLGLLVLAGGGLVFTDVGGFFRGGVGGNDVAKVAGQSVSLQQFDRIAQRTLAPTGITQQQAYKLGYLREILNSEIRRRILVTDAHKNGVVIGREQVVKQIKDILAPAIQNGLNAEQALETLLRNQGMSERELIASLSTERAFAIFSTALQSGTLYSPKTLETTLYDFENETRELHYVPFLNKDFENINKATEEQLSALYNATKEAYAIPERRTLQVLRLKTDKLKDTLEISEEDLKASYEDNIGEFTTPETRTITQAIAKTKEDAQALYDEAVKSKNFKTAAKGADVIPAQGFTEKDILSEIKKPVFGAKETGVLEPLKTPLGWTVINLEKIEEKKVVPYETAKKDLRNVLIEERFVDELYRVVDEIDEAFASGIDFEETAKQYDLSVQTFSGLNVFGQNSGKKTPLNDALAADAGDALKTGFTLLEGETSAMFELSDGDFAAVRAESVKPKSYKPYEDVKAEIEERWNNDQKALGNRAFVAELLTKTEGEFLSDIAKDNKKVSKTVTITRSEEPQDPLNARTIAVAFNSPIEEVFIVDIDGGFALANIRSSSIPEKQDKEELEKVSDTALRNFQNEIFTTYINERSKDYGAKINDKLLERAYGDDKDQ